MMKITLLLTLLIAAFTSHAQKKFKKPNKVTIYTDQNRLIMRVQYNDIYWAAKKVADYYGYGFKNKINPRVIILGVNRLPLQPVVDSAMNILAWLGNFDYIIMHKTIILKNKNKYDTKTP